MTHHIHVTVDNLYMVYYINPVPTDVLCAITHTVVLSIQNGETALDRARDYKQSEVVQYLKEVCKYNISYNKGFCDVTRWL